MGEEYFFHFFSFQRKKSLARLNIPIYYGSMTYEEALTQIGVDVESTLTRFSGNSSLMQRFVLKFPQDKTLAALKAAVEKKDYHELEETSHTLKGVSGNLGFTELYKQSAALCNAVREGQYAKADELSPKVIELADSIVAVLSSVQ